MLHVFDLRAHNLLSSIEVCCRIVPYVASYHVVVRCGALCCAVVCCNFVVPWLCVEKRCYARRSVFQAGRILLLQPVFVPALAWIPYYVLYSVYSRAIIHKHWTSRNRPLTCPWLPRDELGQLGLKNCSLPSSVPACAKCTALSSLVHPLASKRQDDGLRSKDSLRIPSQFCGWRGIKISKESGIPSKAHRHFSKINQIKYRCDYCAIPYDLYLLKGTVFWMTILFSLNLLGTWCLQLRLDIFSREATPQAEASGVAQSLGSLASNFTYDAPQIPVAGRKLYARNGPSIPSHTTTIHHLPTSHNMLCSSEAQSFHLSIYLSI